MLVFVQYDNLHQYSQAFREQFFLRHQCFLERQKYNVFSYKSMEYDQYDTPAAVYLVYLSDTGRALGASRLTPVDHRCMLKDLWPELVDVPNELFGANVWEGTRFCIDKSLPIEIRRKISRELVVGYYEVGLRLGIRNIIGVMPPLIFKAIFGKAGCDYHFLGGQLKLPSGERVAAASMEITEEALSRIRRYTGIYEAVVVNWKAEEQSHILAA